MVHSDTDWGISEGGTEAEAFTERHRGRARFQRIHRLCHHLLHLVSLHPISELCEDLPAEY